ncbi:UDP-glycosyltransferase UGT5-like [Pieris napi]|nr:UDP-glycosyltransferase UGT5-like [Pieris napi]
MLPKETIQMFLNVFAKLPYEVLWKWETNELPGKTDNVKTAQWLPKSDLLRHPNIKLFITQGGLQSTDEAITAGVPLVGIPMFADQWYNVELYEYHQIGQALYMETITEEKQLHAIHTVIDNISYKENVIKLRELLNDQPESPLERSVWWIEYVLRHGGAKHLRAPNANMSMYEFYEIEFLLKLTALVLLSCVVLIATLYYMYLGLI